MSKIVVVAKFLSFDYNGYYNFIVLFNFDNDNDITERNESSDSDDSDDIVHIEKTSEFTDRETLVKLNKVIREDKIAFSPINIKHNKSIYIKVKNINGDKLIPRGHYKLELEMGIRKKLNKTYYNLLLTKSTRINCIKKVDIIKLLS